MDKAETWKHIEADRDYTMIIAHYVADMLGDSEEFISKAASVLANDGVMSLNSFGTVPTEHLQYWIDAFEEFGINSNPLKEKLKVVRR